MDERLRSGSNAFLRKDYAAARRIFDALLRPIARVDIDLGQHERVDEVLGVEPATCVAQYIVATYMTTNAERRAEAARDAIAEVGDLGFVFEPIREMERVAVEPLPELDDFLPRWRDIVAKEASANQHGGWGNDADRWLREVVLRLEGAAGLAKIARSGRRADDLRAWCGSLVEAGDWKAALAAFEEAAQLVTDENYVRGELLDGAALAAQELGRKQLSPWFERAWRGAPTMFRLRRWLGSARGKTIRKRAAEAAAACPKQARRQRAFLHLVQADFEPAAKLLAAAPGLGWSNGEHPGHLLFPLSHALLGGKNPAWTPAFPDRRMEIHELDALTADPDAPRLATPEVGDILQQAGIGGIEDARARKAVITAMRKAAENRVAGVTQQKRRRQYGHAAWLVAACVDCDRSPETVHWADALREQYRRFYALRADLDRHLGPS